VAGIFRDIERGVSKVKGMPIMRYEGIPPQPYWYCANCNKRVAQVPLKRELTKSKAIASQLQEAQKFMKHCPSCDLWVCNDCFNMQTNLCVSCSPITASSAAPGTLQAPAARKFCSNCGNPIGSEAKFCSGCGAPVT
jgi:hypothetical protein